MDIPTGFYTLPSDSELHVGVSSVDAMKEKYVSSTLLVPLVGMLLVPPVHGHHFSYSAYFVKLL